MKFKSPKGLAIQATLAFSLIPVAVSAVADCNAMLKAHSLPVSLEVSDSGQLITDPKTALMWMRCSVGYSFSNGTCDQASATEVGYNWAEALVLADSFEFAGYTDWRLPNRKELDSIVDRACFDPSVDEGLFPGVTATNYWTNSLYNFNMQFAWGIDFASGSHKPLSKQDKYSVLLVRSTND